MQLSQSIQFLNDLLFWCQQRDNEFTGQDSWRNATLDRMEELLADHASYRSISPKIRNLIHALNGDPLKEFLRTPFVEVERIRDDLRNELSNLDRQAAADIATSQRESEDISSIVGRKFLSVYRSNDSQNEKADAIASRVTEEEWSNFKKSRKIGKEKRDYFYKLIMDCDGGKCPMWLESLK